MEAVDVATIIGSIAAVLALGTVLLEVVRWVRRRRARSSLRRELVKLYDLDRELCEVVVEADHRFVDGLGWKGWEIWPDKLVPLLDRFRRLTFELDSMRARVRAQWAEGSIERLRDDIEQLVASLRRATGLYMQGTIERYRESMGKPLMWSASGRAPTRTLADAKANEEVDELRHTTRLLFRSGAYQLDLEDAAEREDVALWPLQERDSITLRKIHGL